MTQEDTGVRVALKRRFGKNEKEIERWLGDYVGVYVTARGYFRKWLTEHLAEHAGWMLDYIDVRLITDVAMASGMLVTLPAKRGPGQIGVYVFVCKPEK
jgi:hypothetical protein